MVNTKLVNEQTAKDVWVLLLVFRIFNSFLVKTFFQPDEYFQSLEPAWQMVFGTDSGAWLTWEWHYQLRSSLHPALFAIAYYLVDKPMALLNFFPQFRAETASVAIFMSVLSPWNWFCSTRTFSNSLETSLTIQALYYWPWDMAIDTGKKVNGKLKEGSSTSTVEGVFRISESVNHLRYSLLLAGIACILRPTNLLIWFCVIMPTIMSLIPGVSQKSSKSPTPRDYTILIREAFICGSLVLVISAFSDRLYFGEWTFPPYQWLNFNISQNLAVFYVPAKSTNSNPMVNTKVIRKPLLTLLILLNIALAAYTTLIHQSAVISVTSFIRHRYETEMLDAQGIPLHSPDAYSYLKHYPASFDEDAPPSLNINYDIKKEENSQYAARGMGTSANPNWKKEREQPFVGFLMPCHSTAWRSRLIHKGLGAWALSCEPPIHLPFEERESYRDEADRFYDDPLRFLREEIVVFPETDENEDEGMEMEKGKIKKQWPRYLVGFEGIESDIREFYDGLAEGTGAGRGKKMKEIWRERNTQWIDDWRRSGDVVVWEFI
ncbi:hypothetical protein EYC80_004412 [Monilinia laxa]|uniref:Mannosyltransferase n=1 Tax=Monilinia laxa TaxID=61186 RepID=A0A5N6KNB1_MONLA|nr:hypothetical protein EYC80_004412 [Monilinia laxa]